MRSGQPSLNSVEKPLWEEWEPNSIVFHRADLRYHLRQAGFDNLTTNNIRNWLYTIGIGAGDNIAKKHYDYIEIRFRNASDIAFLKMSGVIE